MARNNNPYKLKGAIDDLVFYELNGQKVCRKKDSEQGERIKSSPVFEKLRKHHDLFKVVNAIATAVYRLAKVPRIKLDYWQHGQLVKLVANRKELSDMNEEAPSTLLLTHSFGGMRMDQSKQKIPITIQRLEDKVVMTLLDEQFIGSTIEMVTGVYPALYKEDDVWKGENDMVDVKREVLVIETRRIEVEMGFGVTGVVCFEGLVALV